MAPLTATAMGVGASLYMTESVYFEEDTSSGCANVCGKQKLSSRNRTL